MIEKPSQNIPEPPVGEDEEETENFTPVGEEEQELGSVFEFLDKMMGIKKRE